MPVPISPRAKRETSAEISQPRFQGPLLLVPAEREGKREPDDALLPRSGYRF